MRMILDFNKAKEQKELEEKRLEEILEKLTDETNKETKPLINDAINYIGKIKSEKLYELIPTMYYAVNNLSGNNKEKLELLICQKIDKIIPQQEKKIEKGIKENNINQVIIDVKILDLMKFYTQLSEIKAFYGPVIDYLIEEKPKQSTGPTQEYIQGVIDQLKKS